MVLPTPAPPTPTPPPPTPAPTPLNPQQLNNLPELYLVWIITIQGMFAAFAKGTANDKFLYVLNPNDEPLTHQYTDVEIYDAHAYDIETMEPSVPSIVLRLLTRNIAGLVAESAIVG